MIHAMFPHLYVVFIIGSMWSIGMAIDQSPWWLLTLLCNPAIILSHEYAGRKWDWF